MRVIFLSLVGALVCAGCGDDGTFDGGARDTGPARDGGPRVDGGPGSDVGPAVDGGPGSDAGPSADAGPGTDVGPGGDAGPATDAGPPLDAGGADICGGFAGIMCTARDDFCDYAMGCGLDDRSGVCTMRPRMCPRILDPVCGCDGTDYGNPCMAAMAGVSVRSAGRCAAMSDACGGRLGTPCRDREYCHYELADSCGRTDATGVCMARPRMCPDIFRPVCGCDGMDYGNECQAYSAGVSVLNSGMCEM